MVGDSEEDLEALMNAEPEPFSGLAEALNAKVEKLSHDKRISRTIKGLKAERARDRETREIEELAEDEVPKELTPEFVARCAELERKADAAKKAWDGAKKLLKKMVGRSRGLLPYGEYVLDVTERTGQRITDWKQFITDQIGGQAVNDAVGDRYYTKQNEPSVIVRIRERGSGPVGGEAD